VNRVRSHPAPRFALVGCANFLVSLAVFYLCYHYLPLGSSTPMAAGTAEFRPDGAIANVLAYLAGMLNSFLLNRSWTFRAGGSVGVQAVRFAAVNLVSLTTSTVAVFVFVDVLRYPELAVWIPLAGVIVVLNYLGCKHWAFAAPALPTGGPG
jgi:putative flippase GtrA